MLTVEEMVEQGVPQEVAEKIAKSHKDTIDGSYIPKSKFEAERDKSKALTEQVTERDKQIKEFGDFKGTKEELEKKVAKLEESNAADAKKYKEEVKAAEKAAELKFALSDTFIDVSDAIEKLDLAKISLKDGKFSGLKEQVEELMKAKPHWVKQKAADSDDGGGSNEGEGTSDDSAGVPNGWQPFGQEPQDGNDDKAATGAKAKDNEAVAFAKALAAQTNSKLNNTANDYYFGGGHADSSAAAE
jgi:hypothetical protein